MKILPNKGLRLFHPLATTAGPAGGPPEPDLDGLLRTINSGMGEWRLGAGVHKIVLFTHAPATSGAFVGLVETVAHEIGATVTARASASPETMGLGFALSRD